MTDNMKMPPTTYMTPDETTWARLCDIRPIHALGAPSKIIIDLDQNSAKVLYVRPNHVLSRTMLENRVIANEAPFPGRAHGTHHNIDLLRRVLRRTEETCANDPCTIIASVLDSLTATRPRIRDQRPFTTYETAYDLILSPHETWLTRHMHEPDPEYVWRLVRNKFVCALADERQTWHLFAHVERQRCLHVQTNQTLTTVTECANAPETLSDIMRHVKHPLIFGT